MYEPVAEERPAEKMPCIIYMHGNAGNKNEANSYVQLLNERGINLFSFDFSGCGNSDGEYVTLGWKERKDLDTVISYLNDLGTVSKIGLWGRSMGAATSIMYMADNNEKISFAILDSPFESFSSMVTFLASKMMGGLPPQLIDMLMVGVGVQIE